jgi:hypothetical protein
VDRYHPISHATFHQASYDSINGFIAADQYTPPNHTLDTEDLSDAQRLNKTTYPSYYLGYEHIQTKDDVVQDFHRNIAWPVTLAGKRNGVYLERSESGPPGPTNITKTFDHLYSWHRGGNVNDERCQVIGELKQWGIIKEREWDGREAQRTFGKRDKRVSCCSLVKIREQEKN